jgi:metallo-beta-lactamase family protein
MYPVSYGRPIEIATGVTIEFRPAGHLLGSAFLTCTLASGKRILFGGDLGRYNRPVLPDPSPLNDAVASGSPVASGSSVVASGFSRKAFDLALVESTYGDRDHDRDDEGEGLAKVIRDTAQRGGKLIVPSFAIGRVEELLYWIRRLEREQRIPVLPVFVDSPMAVEALKFYTARAAELDPDLRPPQKDVSTFATARFQCVASPQQSKELTASRRSGIVISSSGMATGGRVLHHLEAVLPEPKNTVLFVGYQAAGTRGRSLVDGAPEVKIHGRFIPARARIAKIDSMSAHADRGEILRWLGTFPSKPARLLLVHGEPAPMDAFKATVRERLSLDVQTPEHRARISI